LIQEYRGRASASIENESIRVTVLREGGHIAEILHKPTGVNPLWTPPWPSIEPSRYNVARYPEYGGSIESQLLAGIMGHNLCLDVFGGPSEAEAAQGIGVHGEGSVAPYEIEVTGERMRCGAAFPQAQIRFERTLELEGSTVRIAESVESLASFDRPIGWTQHVTFGPPFLECGVTRFDMPATRSLVFEGAFGAHDYLEPSAVFDWPKAPRIGGGSVDLRTFNSAAQSSAYTAHLMDPALDDAWFIASHPRLAVTLEYRWRRADFPWLGIWEENCSRTGAPWNGRAITRGMEFGVSPVPGTREQMMARGPLFGERTYGWLPAKGRLEARYRARLICE
jgi:hypothetical protein